MLVVLAVIVMVAVVAVVAVVVVAVVVSLPTPWTRQKKVRRLLRASTVLATNLVGTSLVGFLVLCLLYKRDPNP